MARQLWQKLQVIFYKFESTADWRFQEFKALLDSGVGPNDVVYEDQGLLVVHYVARAWCLNDACLALVMNRGGDPNRPMFLGGVTPMHMVAIDRKSTSLLVAHGGDLNVCDADGRTPLWYAVCGESWRCMKTMLTLGACPRVGSHKGVSALDKCTEMLEKRKLSGCNEYYIGKLTKYVAKLESTGGGSGTKGARRSRE